MSRTPSVRTGRIIAIHSTAALHETNFISIMQEPLEATVSMSVVQGFLSGVDRATMMQFAERSGIAQDDVILAFDGKLVASPNELRWLASIAGVNKLAAVRVARGERVFEIQVKLGELAADPGEESDDR